MPKLMLELMEAILGQHPDLSIVGRVPADNKLAVAISRYRADVLILMQPDGSELAKSADQIFWSRPSRVIEIAEGGHKGVVHVLHPHATTLSELSADTLVDAIRSAGEP
jgi:hypothetical protein